MSFDESLVSGAIDSGSPGPKRRRVGRNISPLRTATPTLIDDTDLLI